MNASWKKCWHIICGNILIKLNLFPLYNQHINQIFFNVTEWNVDPMTSCKTVKLWGIDGCDLCFDNCSESEPNVVFD